MQIIKKYLSSLVVVVSLLVIRAEDYHASTNNIESSGGGDGSSVTAGSCVVDPNYCDSIIQQVKQETERSFLGRFESLQIELRNSHTALNECQIHTEKVITESNTVKDVFTKELEAARSEVVTVTTKLTNDIEIANRQTAEAVKQLETLQHEAALLQQKIIELEQASSESDSVSENTIRTLQQSIDEISGQRDMYKKRVEQVLEDKKSLKTEHDQQRVVLEQTKDELFRTRHELFYANEELRKPIERRKMYKQFVLDTWEVVVQYYNDVIDWIYPYYEIGYEFYLENIQPRIDDSVSQLSKIWTNDVYPVIQPQYDSAKLFITTNLQKGYELGTKYSIQFWNDTTDIRATIQLKAVEYWTVLYPILVLAHDHAVEIVFVALDFLLQGLRNYDAPSFVIDAVDTMQDHSQEITLVLAIIFVYTIITTFIQLTLWLIFGRSDVEKIKATTSDNSSSNKPPTTEQGKSNNNSTPKNHQTNGKHNKKHK